MKYDCDVIRDLLPLYADKVCSENSRQIVEEHLQECPDCRGVAGMLLETEIENRLQAERDSVLQYGVREFRRRSAAVGSAVSGALMIPILICLVANLIFRPSLNWVSLVLVSLCIPASLIIVPLTVQEDKLFWTFCAFCASLLMLLGAACLYSHGDWFWIAASAVLFGLSVIFLPFLVKAGPVRKLIGQTNRLAIILGVDAALFFNMLNAIDAHGRITFSNIMFTIGVLGGIVCVVYAVIRNKKTEAGAGNSSIANISEGSDVKTGK